MDRAPFARRAVAGLILALVLVLGWPLPAIRAADPQPYAVTLAATTDPALNEALTASSELVALRTSAPVGPFALVARARQDVERLTTVLQSFGYYNAKVTIRIDGLGLDDPGLLHRLEAAPAAPPAAVAVHFAPGKQFHLGHIALTGEVPSWAAAKLGLKSGAPAEAAAILAARARLLAALRGQGYALAKVELEPATLYLHEDRMDLAFKVTTGPQVNIGPISFTGLKGINEDFVRRRIGLHEGERFSPAAIESARQDLLSLPAFSFVQAQPAKALDPAGTLPITFNIGERKVHAVDLSADYSTDLGVGLSAGWHDRNLFGNAEQLNLLAAFQGGGNSQIRPGYKVNGQFLKPDFLRRHQTLEANAGIVYQSLLPYTQKALTQSLVLHRKLSEHWSASLGIAGVEEGITQQDVLTHYTIVSLPFVLSYDDANSTLDPTHGYRFTLTLTPAQSLFGKQATFLTAQLAGSGYFDLSGNGRSVLALRGLVGQVVGASQFSLPPDQRFYAGGSGTVRGYKYQSIGPQFADGTPIGGTQITAASIEFRQRFLKNWGFSVFSDAGEVAVPGGDYHAKYGVGAGAGLAYYTPIGPVRAQIAVPVVRLPNSGSFQIYIGIGQAF